MRIIQGGLKMREILFRGKRVDNGEWIEGVPIKTYDTEIGINLPLRYKAKNITLMNNDRVELCCAMDESAYFDTENYPIIDDETIGQYTGLRDKNSVKIFENDIVRYGKKNWVVNWNDETFRWEISLKDGCYQYPIYDGQGYPKYVDRITLGWVAAEFQLSGQLSVEVIGNKFDNPELIERDNNEKDWIF